MTILMILHLVALVLLLGISMLAIMTAGIKVAEKILREKNNDNR
jgi:multisubunit Na+/H+ antiporter MnhE subunit